MPMSRVVGRGILAALQIFRCTPDNSPAGPSGDGAQNPFPTEDLGDGVEVRRHDYPTSPLPQPNLSRASSLTCSLARVTAQGWGLRLTRRVKAGTFICEFIGVIAAAATAENHH